MIREVNYTYDPLDKRIGVSDDPDGSGPQQPTVRWTAYDGVNPYADFDGSGNLTYRYLYGPAVDMILGRFSASGTTAWYLADHLGTVRDIASKTGTVLDHIKYDSFGRVLSESNPSNGDRFKFTGRELDSATGQYYYRARYYDAAVGRFLSEDPIGFAAGDANLARYVRNSATNYTDPTGEVWRNPFTWFTPSPPPPSPPNPPPQPGILLPNAPPVIRYIPSHSGGASIPIYPDPRLRIPTPHPGGFTTPPLTDEQKRMIIVLITTHFAPIVGKGPKELHPLIDKAFEIAEKHGVPHLIENWPKIKESLMPARPSSPPPPVWPFPGAFPGTPCFIAGTLVHTEAGLRHIETVCTGTNVWAYDHERQIWALGRVIDTEAHDYAGRTVALQAGDDTIESTATHAFWVVSGEALETGPPANARGNAARGLTVSGRWLAAQHIGRGDRLLARDGRLITVQATETAEKTVRVFNLRVERLNSYALGGAGLLVNNM